MKTRIIYTCGDSHTAGGETADDLLWPAQHPGFFDHDQLHLRDPRALSQWRQHRQRSLQKNDPVGYAEWIAAEMQQSWPTQLAVITGCRVINSARIGASMEWIARQALGDIAALLNQHAPQDILVLLQPSTFVRLQIIGSDGSWTSLQLNNAPNSREMPPEVHRWFCDRETDAALVSRWLVAVISVISWCKAQQIPILLIDSGHMPDLNQWRSDQLCRNLWTAYDVTASSCWHSVSMRHIGQNIPQSLCPDLHWSRAVHQGFAAALASDIA